MKHVLLTTVMLAGLAACDAINAPTGTSADDGVDVPVPAETSEGTETAEAPAPNVIEGTEGDDEIEGTNEDDEIFGLGGNDKLQGFAGDDFLHGGLGDDMLFGSLGIDKLIGGGGSDRLVGGEDDDLLIGEGNRDYFTFEGPWGNDTIEDFSPTVDILDFIRVNLKADGETDADAYAKLTIVSDGADTIIRVTGDDANSVRILGLQPDEIPADRFRF